MSQTAETEPVTPRPECLRGTGQPAASPESSFDRAARLAARLLVARASLVALVDGGRPLLKSTIGLPGLPETPWAQALCQQVVAEDRAVIVDDARNNPDAAELGIGAYLGVPLTTPDGLVLGALCVGDSAPRTWGEDDAATLADLAATVTTEIGLREQVARSGRDAAERLRESERKFRAIFDATFQFVSLLAPDGTILQANRTALEFAGVTADEVSGLPFPETPWWKGPESLRDRLRSAIAEAARGQFVRFEAEHTGADGRVIIVDFSLNPVRSESGRVVILIAEGRDITGRKRAEDALRDADRRKDEFLAVLAHELRNPLAAISHAVRVLELRDDEPLLRTQMRELILAQSRTLTRLVDDLLDVARIARGKARLRPETLELSEAVARAVATTRPQMHLRDHRLTTELPDRPVVLQADPLRFGQVLVNLLTNAAKYTDPGGEIVVGAAIEGAHVRVWVRDNGVGIAPELLPRVFDPFTQADQTLDHSRGGLGVGLTLVRGLVALHGGTVEAHSPGPGLGSEFVIRLPIAGPTGTTDAETAPPTAGADERSGRPQTGVTHRRILVVDDNVSATDALALILRHWGHTVLVCHDGRAGLDAAGEFRPDVVLLDIGLPGLDGYAVARLLRDRPEHRNAVLIAITGYGRDEDRQRSDGAGLDHHFVKPINLNALEALLADPALAPKAVATGGGQAEGLGESKAVVPGYGFVETGRR